MNPNNEKCKQNGGQPSLSCNNVQSLENKAKDNVCRDYVWGKCTKTHCKFVHECDIQTMLNILQFCHDYQNSTGCKRPNCTFLHATREEEKLFREEGQFPPDLQKRHHQMLAATVNMSRKYEDAFTNKPPPPPLDNQMPPAQMMMNQMYQPAPRWFLQPPPPPPPPPKEPSPPPHIFSTGPPPPAVYHPAIENIIDTSRPPPRLFQQVRNGVKKPESHEGSPPKPSTSTACHHHSNPQMFEPLDTSKPPPPLFPNPVKRSLTDLHTDNEAGPSKVQRKANSDSSCDNCPRWEIRNLLLETKLSDKIAEKAVSVLKYEEKKKEITNLVAVCCLGAPHAEASSSVSNDLSLDDSLIRALITNNIKDKTDVVAKKNNNSMLRKLTDILKEVDGGLNTNGNISHGLERLLNVDLDVNISEPLSKAPPASVSAPHSFPTNSVVSTPAPLPPMQPQFMQTYRPMHNQHNPYQYPAGPSTSNGGGESMVKPISSASIQPAPVMPPFSENNYYNMMGPSTSKGGGGAMNKPPLGAPMQPAPHMPPFNDPNKYYMGRPRPPFQ